MPLDLKLVYDEKQSVAPKAAILEVDRSTKPTITDGMAKMRVRITELSMNHGNKSFRIVVTPKNEGERPLARMHILCTRFAYYVPSGCSAQPDSADQQQASHHLHKVPHVLGYQTVH